MTYVVRDEWERLDRIAKAIYGTEQGGTVELLLAANPGLADLGPLLPRGTAIEEPPRPEPQPSVNFTRPWE